MKIENIEKFFLETPLYEKFSFEKTDANLIFDLLHFKGKIDCYCSQCKRESTFIGTNKDPRIGNFTYNSIADMSNLGGKNYFRDEVYLINLYCSRKEQHKMQQIISIEGKQIFKIGQNPSLAELSQPELKKYRTILNPEKYSELNRGVGLIAHGVGIGAFVYLRRIFEDLIEEAHQILNKSGDWDVDKYSKARMKDKIEILKSELPEFLVENKAIYGILSKGIHELNEDECKEYFPTVKLGIEMILDEKIEVKKRKEKISQAKNSIAKITGALKNQ